MVLDFDLNELPAEDRQFKDDVASMHLQHKKITSLGSPGSFSSPIDADSIDDDDDDEDVILLPSSSWVAPAKSRSRRKRPLTLMIDEILETHTWQSGDVEEPVTVLSLSIKKLHTQIPLGKTIIHSDLDVDENCHMKMSEGTKLNPDTQTQNSAPRKERTLACALCLESLKDASSTICGHLFCRSCIETAVSRQKMCPICRRKLTKKNYHRIYFPKAQGICLS